MKKATYLFSILFFAALACNFSGSGSQGNPVDTQVALVLTEKASSLEPTLQQPGATEGQTNAPDVPTDTAMPPSLTPSNTATNTETPTFTPTFTSTATFTKSPTASYTPPSDDPRALLGNPSWKDTFPSNTTTFGPPASIAGIFDGLTAELVDHQLKLTNTKPKTYDQWYFTWHKLDKFYLEMTAQFEHCSGKDRYGILFAAPDNKYSQGFLFEFSCEGQFIVRYVEEVDGKGKFVDTPINWKTSSAINSGPGPTNRLGIRRDGSNMRFFANGVFLGEVNDGRAVQGRFGLAVAVENGDYILRISEIAYWNL